jgi:hypothetical protein
MGCKCSEYKDELDMKVKQDKKLDNATTSSMTASAILPTSNNMNSKQNFSTKKLTGGIVNDQQLDKKFEKKDSLPNKNSLDSSITQQHSINHTDSKFKVTTNIFKRENKQSIYNFYELQHIIGKGIQLIRVVR